MAEGLRIELRAALVSEAMPAAAAEAIERTFQSSLEDKDKGGPLSYSPHVYARRLLPSPATLPCYPTLLPSHASVAFYRRLQLSCLPPGTMPSTALFIPHPFCHRL